MILPSTEPLLYQCNCVSKFGARALNLIADLLLGQVCQVSHQLFQCLASLKLALALQLVEIVCEAEIGYASSRLLLLHDDIARGADTRSHGSTARALVVLRIEIVLVARVANWCSSRGCRRSCCRVLCQLRTLGCTSLPQWRLLLVGFGSTTRWLHGVWTGIRAAKAPHQRVVNVVVCIVSGRLCRSFKITRITG